MVRPSGAAPPMAADCSAGGESADVRFERGFARWVGMVLARFLETQRWTAMEEDYASSAWMEDSTEEGA